MSYFVLAGSLAADHLALDPLSASPESVRLPDGRDIPHDGQGPIRPGEKRTAGVRLGPLLGPLNLPRRPGGGLWNAVEALATLHGGRGASSKIRAAHGVRLPAWLEERFARAGVEALGLASAGLAENLIFPAAEGGDRCILRDPVPTPTGPPAGLTARAARAVHGARVLVLNSLKCRHQFAALTAAAGARGIPQVVSLAGSLPLEVLHAACRAGHTATVVGNWSEWRAFLTRFSPGLALPDDAEDRIPREVLAGLPGHAWELGLAGDVLCTLGRAGLILGERATGRVWHVRLSLPEPWRRVQGGLASRPDLRNGMGDWLLGCWVGERWGGEAREAAGVLAAVRATEDLFRLRGVCPEGIRAQARLIRRGGRARRRPAGRPGLGMAGT